MRDFPYICRDFSFTGIMTIVSASSFRANQSKYIGMAHGGEEVILTSRAGRVKLVPDYDDNVITPELQAKIDAARKDFREGKCLTLHSEEEIRNWFQSL